MIQAIAQGMPRGFSWAWLAIGTLAFSPGLALAQTPPSPKVEAMPPVDDDKPAPEKAEPVDSEPTAEVFIDPAAKRTLAIFSPMVYGGPQIKVGGAGDDRSRVLNMLNGSINIDPEFLKRYVEYFAIELTRRDNINALLNLPPPLAANKAPDPRLRNLELAVDALTRPILEAKHSNKAEFLRIYTRLLFESPLPKVLENNYLSRIDAMIVLGTAGSTEVPALGLYIDQLKKPDQVIWVKLWAARGLSNAAQGGAVDLDAARANQAADALIGFLDDSKLPWPAQMRALEALGSIRVATATNPKKIDAASVAMRFLADPEARSEVRAWAAWALGMMKVSPNLAPYNFNLLGHEIGELAIDLGQQIVEEFDHDPVNFDREKDLASHLTGLLLFQVYPALIGEEGVRDSGLLRSPHPNAGPAAARPFLAKVDEKVKAITREAFELLRAGGTANKARRNDLDARITDLKVFLGQVSPKDRHLVPGGPEFAPNPAEQVAGAPGP